MFFFIFMQIDLKGGLDENHSMTKYPKNKTPKTFKPQQLETKTKLLQNIPPSVWICHLTAELSISCVTSYKYSLSQRKNTPPPPTHCTAHIKYFSAFKWQIGASWRDEMIDKHCDIPPVCQQHSLTGLFTAEDRNTGEPPPSTPLLYASTKFYAYTKLWFHVCLPLFTHQRQIRPVTCCICLNRLATKPVQSCSVSECVSNAVL